MTRSAIQENVRNIPHSVDMPLLLEETRPVESLSHSQINVGSPSGSFLLGFGYLAAKLERQVLPSNCWRP